jgi:hypothetical protein
MHLFVTDMCAQTQYLFFFYLRQIPLLFILVSSQLIYFYDPLFLQFFFLFFKKLKKFSLFRLFIYTVSIIQLILLVIMLLWWWWLFFFLLRGGKRRRKNEFWKKKKWIRKITEFELFRAIAPTPFPFFFIFFYLFFPPLTGWDRDGDVINCGGHIIGIEAVCVCVCVRETHFVAHKIWSLLSLSLSATLPLIEFHILIQLLLFYFIFLFGCVCVLYILVFRCGGSSLSIPISPSRKNW